jgi:integrase/recombinase XerD
VGDVNTPETERLLAAWRTALRAEARTRDTIDTRVYGVTSLAKTCDPVHATTDEVRAWLADQRSPWTTRTYFVTARRWYAFLLERGARADDPTAVMRAPRLPKRVPRPLDAAALEQCLADAQGVTYAYLLLGAFEGLRVSEIARVRGEDVTRAGIRVRGKGGREDVLPTHPLVWELAQGMPRRGWWFPSPNARRGHVLAGTVSTHLSRYFAEVGVDGTAHMLRHSFGTRVLAASGRDLLTTSQLMRHENPATTAGYLLVDDAHRAAVIHGLPGGRRGTLSA